MSDDGQKIAGRLSSAEEEEVFSSAASDPLAQAPKDADTPSKRPSMISSGPFEISPSSFSSPPPPSRTSGPPAAVIENAMERGRPQMSLAAIVGIAAAIFVVVVVLSLLLFR